jgi:purine catabolism regulator
MVAEAGRRGLPLVALRSAIPFVEVTERVHAEIINRQFAMIQKAERIGRSFTELVLRGSGFRAVVEGLGEIVRRPVVLENAVHQVVDYWDAPGHDSSALVAWETHARTGHRGPAPPLSVITERDVGDVGCEWTPIPLHQQEWGRLHVLPYGPSLDEIDRLALDRAAVAVALTVLSQKDAAHAADRAGGDFVTDIIRGTLLSEEDLYRRAQALGCDLRDRRLTAMDVDADDFQGFVRTRQLEEAEIQTVKRTMLSVTRHALNEAGCVGISAIDSDEVLTIVGVPSGGPVEERLDDIGRRIRQMLPEQAHGLSATIGVSREVGSIMSLPHAFQQAREAVLSGKSARGGSGVYHFQQLGLDTLILRLRGSNELALFVESELGPLLDHDATRHPPLVPTLRAYLESGGNKSATSKAIHLDRRSVYHRLDRIAEVLGHGLDDADVRARLHVALKALSILSRSPAR